MRKEVTKVAVRTMEEIIEMVSERIGDDNSDEAISFLEDISDTLSDYDSRAKDNTDWKQKYTDNDAEWRRKYKERFYNPPQNQEPDNHEFTTGEHENDNVEITTGEHENDNVEITTFEELFKEEK